MGTSIDGLMPATYLVDQYGQPYGVKHTSNKILIGGYNETSSELEASAKLIDEAGASYGVKHTDNEIHTIVTKVQGVISSVNSTTTVLDPAGTNVFTGTGEDVSDYKSIGINIIASQASATDGLTFQFSSDGTNWDKVHSFTLAAVTAKFFNIPVEAKWFRVVYTNGSVIQAYFRLQAIYHATMTKESTLRLSEVIDGEVAAQLGRMVIAGLAPDTTYKNVLVTNSGGLKVSLEEFGSAFNTAPFPVTDSTIVKSAFGETLSAELTPIVQLQFSYNINAILIDSRANQSGTVTQASNMAHLSTGAAANSSAQILSKIPIKYNPGQGGLARFTGVFTTGVANSTQLLGIGDSGDGYFFGYNGAAFGVLRRKGGMPEVRTLTVSTKSSHAENITITLDSDADATVAVTNGADTTVTANEIAAHDYSDVGRGWHTEAVGATVVFFSWDSAVHTGTYTLSGATSAVGTFAQSLAGVAPTDTWAAQTAWSEDKAAGAEVLPAMVWTYGNVFQVRYQWLGFGLVSFWAENPSTGEMIKVHQIEYANAYTSPSVNNPTLPLCAIVENAANTSDLTMDIGSTAGFVEGKDELLGTRRGVKNNKTNAGATEIPISSIRNKTVYQSKLNRTKVKILLVSMAVEHTKPMTVNFYSNPTLVADSFADIGTNTSVIQTDTAATSFSGGTLLFSVDLGKTGSEIIDLTGDKHAEILLPGNHFTATSIPNSGNGSETNVTFNFAELF